MIGIAKTIGRLIAVLVDVGVVEREQAVWILEPLKYKAESVEWIDDKCSACGKGIEDLIDSPEWYHNENPNYCPFCGRKLVKGESE